ncbi:hypothetical protein [Paenibacillus sp.]|uniref:hypothetical protein n=1 Tax=Paenibacillus sp. TaxID=58172 RepID=UPI00282AD6B4|nr:hypothetical protein [Paenibacillus sp.]MDR0267084.1 hypothetical protein [Paenibacillus sp.]
MNQKDDEKVTSESQEIPSFNSVTDHYKNIIGVPTNKVDMKRMPRILRFFGYFVFIFMVVCSVIFIILYFLQFL